MLCMIISVDPTLCEAVIRHTLRFMMIVYQMLIRIIMVKRLERVRLLVRHRAVSSPVSGSVCQRRERPDGQQSLCPC